MQLCARLCWYGALLFAGTFACAGDETVESTVGADTMKGDANEHRCGPNTAPFSLDSADAVDRAQVELIGDAALPLDHILSTFRRDSTGYTIRLTPIDPPGSIVFGASGIVRVCLDGRAVVLSVDQPPR